MTTVGEVTTTTVVEIHMLEEMMHMLEIPAKENMVLKEVKKTFSEAPQATSSKKRIPFLKSLEIFRAPR